MLLEELELLKGYEGEFFFWGFYIDYFRLYVFY